MKKYYTNEVKHYNAVDCIIFGFDRSQLKLLCIKRNIEPKRGEWSLMGGFVREGEGIDEAAVRVLHELTGLSDIYLEQLQAYGAVDRDPAARVVSVAYFALIDSVKFEHEISGDYEARWFGLAELPNLVFDHGEMVQKALRRLKRKCRTEPVGFELLPPRFTLPQLMTLYEAIFQQSFDKRNFRKKILSNGILKRLDEKDMQGSRKGAYLYMFEKNMYEEKRQNGIHFEI